MFDLFETKIGLLPRIIVEQSLRHDADEILHEIWPGLKLAVVDDVNTGAAAGEKIFKALASRFDCAHVHFPSSAVADDTACKWLEHETKQADALVAVGSGSINDLCKYVSHRNGKPYVVFPTAASMNGYVSAAASIKVQGYKSSLPGHMPAAVLCDMGVIAAAPVRLNKSGLGDSLARSTAQADWLLSHLLTGSDYDAALFEPLLEYEDVLLDQARGVAQGDAASLRLLMDVLLASGFGMTAACSSAPASGAEHMLAHSYSMLKIAQPLPKTLHGEEIGVTALHIAKQYEQLMNQKPALQPDAFDDEEIKKLYGSKVAKEAQKAFAEKCERVTEPGAPVKNWDDIASQLEEVLLPPHVLRKALEDMDAATSPEQLSWNPACFATAQRTARFMRDRFTCLDLAVTPG